MKHKLITILTSLVAICGLCGCLAVPAYASTPASTQDLCSMSDDEVPAAIKQAAGCGTTSDYDLGATIQNIVNSVILVLGTLAVVIIIIGGISYMTSSGDAAKLKKAKDTILYACIGLVICVLSFAIVNFTINIIGGNVTTTTQSGSGDPDGNDDPDEGGDGELSCGHFDTSSGTPVWVPEPCN